MYLEGYNEEEARAYIVSHIEQTGRYKDLSHEQLEAVVKEAIIQDEAYMKEAGIIEEGNDDEAFYDDDDAFETIVDRIVDGNKFPELHEMKIAQIVDEYMEFNQAYLEEKGLLAWDDEE